MFSKILIVGPCGSYAHEQAGKIAAKIDYNLVSLEDALNCEINNKTFVGNKILRSIKYKKYEYSILGDILSKALQSDKWIMVGFQPSVDLITTFDDIETYPDLVIVLLNSQVSLLDRLIKTHTKDIHLANEKIVEFLENIDIFITKVEQMNIPIYTINDNKNPKDIHKIMIEIISSYNF